MTQKEKTIIETAERLSSNSRGSHWESHHESPSVEVLSEALRLISEVIFPEYLLKCRGEILKHKTAINLERIFTLMNDQICKAMTIKDEDYILSSTESLTCKFIESLGDIKCLLTTDVEAIYKADPAARSYDEIVLCYPTITAMIHHRVAHSLHTLGVPIIPRVISEISHSKTGIDIHPGATIASHFAIDHGTGVVIGETTKIGTGVVIYQGVTLGARGFRFDENGNALNVPRHPIIEDNVRIYSNSSILGCITIGHDSIIGGNMWIDKDVAPNSFVVRER